MGDDTFNSERVTEGLKKFLDGMLAAGNFKLAFEIRNTAGHFERDYENPDLVVDFSGPDIGLLLENKGELLRAIEQVALEAVGLERTAYEKVIFDCQEYRMMRFAELSLAAQAAADKVKRSGVPYKFGAMSGRERRVIHMTLRGNADVLTESEGMGLHRQVVVHPRHGSSSRAPGRPGR
jgi:spoIIIJ-associated protein